MPVSYLGRGSYIKVGQESSWGSSVAQTVTSRVISMGLISSQEREGVSDLSTSDGAFAFRSFDAFYDSGGSITIPCQYDGTGIWIYNSLFKTPTTTGPDGSSLYTHTYLPSTDSPSMTVNVQRGSGTSERFVGAMVASMSISITAGEQMEMELDLICKQSESGGSGPRAAGLGSPTFGNGLAVNHYEAGTLGYNSQTYDIRSMTFSLDNKLEKRNLLGSKYTAQPAITDRRQVTLEVTADWEDDQLYDAQIDGTASDVTIRFTNSSNHYFEITLNEAKLTSYNDNIDSVGRVERTMTFEGFATSGGNAACEIVIKNASSSAVAN